MRNICLENILNQCTMKLPTPPSKCRKNTKPDVNRPWKWGQGKVTCAWLTCTHHERDDQDVDQT